jgi:hypothetical protein
MFQRNLLSSSSGLTGKPCRKGTTRYREMGAKYPRAACKSIGDADPSKEKQGFEMKDVAGWVHGTPQT